VTAEPRTRDASGGGIPAPCAGWQNGIGTMETKQVDQTVQKWMEEFHVPAVALAVLHQGQLTTAKGYGYANLEHMVAATERTVFRIASITKTFTATAIMMLVEQGKAGLDDSISRYLSYLPPNWSPITLRHLLSHTAGIGNYEALLPDGWKPDDPYENIVRLVSELPLTCCPGEEWRYCNSNYIILGVLVEQLSGQPYREFVREQILVALGMNETRWSYAEEIVPNRAQGYAWDSETLSSPGHPPLRNRDKHTPVWDYADGGLLSTVVDLAKWDAALDAEELLQRSTLQQMWMSTRVADGTAVDYGLGWIVQTTGGHRSVGHWGRNPGFMAEISRFVDRGVTVISLCNRWKADIGSLVKNIASLYV
jgi:D-alanyl-D-alanine carboxypeptidase